MRHLCLIAATALMICVASSAAEPAKTFPTGKFEAKAPGGERTWTLDFDGKGTVTVARDGKVAVEASYKVDGQTIEFKDVKGPDADPDGGTGTYKWSLDGDKLTFTAVKDEHTGRKNALTSGAWARVKGDEKAGKE